MTEDAPGPQSVIQRLEQVIADRWRERPQGSYVAELAAGGHPVMSGKLVEEAYELVEACAEEDRFAQIHEAADLVFHLLVLQRAAGISWSDVEAELRNRFGIGGLAEKSRRSEGAQS